VSAEPGRLLVVDDTEVNRDLLARRLRRLGHSVETAKSGGEALEKLSAAEFDLVLLDIMMPGLDGYEVLRRLRDDPQRRHVPVIMISAVDEIESVVRCIELGATDYLPKPFNPVILRARVSATLEKKRLHDQQRFWARSLERELEIGREIQASFLPEALPELAGWEIAASFAPARQVGGDFYDAFPLPGGRLGLVLADVCDKGVGAALFMALFRTLIRSNAEREESASDAEHSRSTIGRTNEYIVRTHGRANMFATVFFGVLELTTGRLSYVNAGHEPPILLGGSGEPERLAPTGPAVGLMPDSSFGSGETQLGSNQILLGITDGVTEARSPAGELFGEPRLLVLAAEPVSSASALLDRIASEVRQHTGGAEPTDDVTLLAVRRTRPG